MHAASILHQGDDHLMTFCCMNAVHVAMHNAIMHTAEAGARAGHKHTRWRGRKQTRATRRYNCGIACHILASALVVVYSAYASGGTK